MNLTVKKLFQYILKNICIFSMVRYYRYRIRIIVQLGDYKVGVIVAEIVDEAQYKICGLQLYIAGVA